MPENDYLEIKVPKLKKPKQLLVPLLIVLVMVLSFGLGAMFVKLQDLEKNGGNVLGAVNSQVKSLPDQFVAYAKQLGLNESQFRSCYTTQKYLSRVNSQITEGTNIGVSATPTFFINGRMLAGAYPIDQFRNIIDKELDGTGSTDATAYDQVLQQGYANAQQRSFDPSPKDIPLGDAPTKGTDNAKVTIVEYSDFQCPFCERAFPTVNQVMSEYKGKIKLVYKQYPLTSIHPNAMNGSLASECAREQGKFWEYHDLLFQNQSAWVNLSQNS